MAPPNLRCNKCGGKIKRKQEDDFGWAYCPSFYFPLYKAYFCNVCNHTQYWPPLPEEGK